MSLLPMFAALMAGKIMGSISGSVTYDGYNPDDLRPAQVTLYGADGAPLRALEVMRGEGFVFEDVPLGTYTVTARKKNHTEYEVYNVALAGGEAALGEMTLWAGDMDLTPGGKNNVIDSYDRSLLQAYYGAAGAAAEPYDVNDDGVIDGLDRLLQIGANYGKTGTRVDFA